MKDIQKARASSNDRERGVSRVAQPNVVVLDLA